MFRQNQNGDTIVEVLVSLAVMGLVIAGAFSIVNVALRNSRQAQERSEATKIAESQIEAIKASDSAKPARFCMAGSKTPVSFAEAPPSNLDEETYTSYPAGCRELGTGRLYFASVEHTDDRYTVTVRWERIGGGKEQLTMAYEGYEQ